MLGFDAIGRLALGQLGNAAISQPLTAMCAAMSRARVAGSFAGVLAGKVTSESASRVNQTMTGVLAARASAAAAMRAPGGVAIKGRVTTQAKANVPAGFLFPGGRISGMSSAQPDIHIQGIVFGPRKALLLNGTAPIIATYWKGNG